MSTQPKTLDFRSAWLYLGISAEHLEKAVDQGKVQVIRCESLPAFSQHFRFDVAELERVKGTI